MFANNSNKKKKKNTLRNVTIYDSVSYQNV